MTCVPLGTTNQPWDLFFDGTGATSNMHKRKIEAIRPPSPAEFLPLLRKAACPSTCCSGSASSQ